MIGGKKTCTLCEIKRNWIFSPDKYLVYTCSDLFWKKNARENIKTNINPQVPQYQDESDDDNDADDKQHKKATWAFGSGKLKITVSLKFWLNIQWWENVFFSYAYQVELNIICLENITMKMINIHWKFITRNNTLVKYNITLRWARLLQVQCILLYIYIDIPCMASNFN